MNDVGIMVTKDSQPTLSALHEWGTIQNKMEFICVSGLKMMIQILCSEVKGGDAYTTAKRN